MWPSFLHHLSLHFPIVLSMGLAAAATYGLRRDDPELLRPLVRWGGWANLAMTSLAVVSGLVAGGFSGGSEDLSHHRYLGITAFFVIALAATSYDYGQRHNLVDWRRFGGLLWWVATFAVIGTGHWGGLAEHRAVVPW
ncbi:hypothetical protein DL240_10960 [Lujinxingia litoralis]|uniref:DUF2231 domain-containing protein n=1 Tax=Lujinxingia litoralis TaxID=2211119 RepID=A0A328C4W4_9DELT|nr:hypothetical protein [Lujinxingia litoralis]RAL22361.1 hypothetical protein DL240_10960 [Lujinxingia litoralis]